MKSYEDLLLVILVALACPLVLPMVCGEEKEEKE